MDLTNQVILVFFKVNVKLLKLINRERIRSIAQCNLGPIL